MPAIQGPEDQDLHFCFALEPAIALNPSIAAGSTVSLAQGLVVRLNWSDRQLALPIEDPQTKAMWATPQNRSQSLLSTAALQFWHS